MIFRRNSVFTFVVCTSMICILIITSCGKDPDMDASLRNYEIQLINGLTDEPIPNTPISIFYGLGGTYSLDFAEGITDANGMVNLQLDVDQDTVDFLLEEASWLDESHIQQTISINTEQYILYELFQDTAKTIFRPKLEEDKLIIAKAYEPIRNVFRVIDEPPYRERDEYCFYEILLSHPKFSFPYYGSNVAIFREENPDTSEIIIYLAEGVEYTAEYALTYLTDTLMGTLDTFFQSSIQFTGDKSKEGEVYEIKF